MINLKPELLNKSTNSVDPDQTPRSVASDLGQHCLLRSVYLNAKSKYIYTDVSDEVAEFP